MILSLTACSHRPGPAGFERGSVGTKMEERSHRAHLDAAELALFLQSFDMELNNHSSEPHPARAASACRSKPRSNGVRLKLLHMQYCLNTSSSKLFCKNTSTCDGEAGHEFAGLKLSQVPGSCHPAQCGRRRVGQAASHGRAWHSRRSKAASRDPGITPVRARA